jgi:hypothetical protein
MTTPSSSSSSPFTLLTWLGPSSMTCPEIDQLLGGSQGDLHQQLSGHIHAVGQPLGFEGLSVEAGQIPTGLQLTLRSATSSPKICDTDVILAF